MTGVRVRAPGAADLPAWVAMRAALWPEEDAGALAAEAARWLHAGADGVFLAEVDGQPAGMAEASLRHGHVNGTATSPVGFLEAWYVAPPWRGRGIGRALVQAVEAWTRVRGCTELASDARLDNTAGRAAHLACGFAEAERVVFFRRRVG